MPRVRWAVRCHAHRTDGNPCGNYAIRGGRTCRKHGGASPNARKTAHLRLVHADLYRAAERERANLAVRLTTWQTNRVLFAAAVLDEDPAVIARERLTPVLVETYYDAPPPPKPEPKNDMRMRVRRPGYVWQVDIPGVQMRQPARGRHYPYCKGWPVPGGGMCIAEIDVVLAAIKAQL